MRNNVKYPRTEETFGAWFGPYVVPRSHSDCGERLRVKVKIAAVEYLPLHFPLSPGPSL